MQAERRAADIWGDLKSADVLETQARKNGRALCHVEHVHGNVINVTMTEGTSIGAMLDELGVSRKPKARE